VVRGEVLERWDVAATVGFVGAGFAGLHDGAAGVEAAAWGDVSGVRGLAGEDLLGAAAAYLWGYGEEGAGVGVEWIGEDSLGRSELDDLAEVHYGHAVCERPGEGQVMGDQN
jgi:hypothetical protein